MPPSSRYRSQYHRFGLLAQGQFGKVYCALHRRSGKMVALKILDTRRSPTADFLRELSSTLALNHPNLVQVYGVEHQPDQRHLILDYCEGGTLRQLLNTEPKPRRGVLLQLIIKLLAGLHHAHSRGIIHCDVKPENILLTLTPQGWCPKLTDFGIAQNQALPNTKTLGSPAYMAPEYFDGHISPAVDIYAVGIILYEVLVGQRPFQGAPDQLRTAHHTQAIPWPCSIPPVLQVILERTLAKHPSERFDSTEHLAQTLKAASEQIDALPSAQKEEQPIVGPQISLFEAWSLPEQALPSSTTLPPPSPAAESIALAPDRSWGARVEIAQGQFYCLRKGQWSSPYALPRSLFPFLDKHPFLDKQKTLGNKQAPWPAERKTDPKVLILDRRHGVIWLPSAGQTQLTLFNRRGGILAPITLATEITEAFPSHHPWQLLAFEKQAPQVLLKISLHPFRVQRIPLAIAPVAVLSLSWGIVLADPQGRLFLIDHEGHGLGLVAPSFQDLNRDLNRTIDKNIDKTDTQNQANNKKSAKNGVKISKSVIQPEKKSKLELFAVNDWEVGLKLSSESPHHPNQTQRICLKDLELELIF